MLIILPLSTAAVPAACCTCFLTLRVRGYAPPVRHCALHTDTWYLLPDTKQSEHPTVRGITPYPGDEATYPREAAARRSPPVLSVCGVAATPSRGWAASCTAAAVASYVAAVSTSVYVRTGTYCVRLALFGSGVFLCGRRRPLNALVLVC